MSVSPAIERPELTLPAEEAAWLRGAYEGASTILEYGSGGSTLMGAELPGKVIWSVESDAAWAARMQGWLEAHPPVAEVRIRHVDIGPTRRWGHPAGKADFERYPRYPLSVWDAPGFPHPDVVLVDGRFRVGCFLATLFRIRRPVQLYFDDYRGRRAYHVVEDFVAPAELRGRMARFELSPRRVAPEEILSVVEAMLRPQ
jgi:hypothetical protein